MSGDRFRFGERRCQLNEMIAKASLAGTLCETGLDDGGVIAPMFEPLAVFDRGGAAPRMLVNFFPLAVDFCMHSLSFVIAQWLWQLATSLWLRPFGSVSLQRSPTPATQSSSALDGALLSSKGISVRQKGPTLILVSSRCSSPSLRRQNSRIFRHRGAQCATCEWP
jgi:hypothetical protein